MSAFVERYQEIYEKDPNSKVFAPLAEAYRRMGLLDEAIELAEAGVAKHPHFSSGRVALGKVYAQKDRHLDAIVHLKAAVDISPENILAHQILAESYFKLGKLHDAMQSYKMVLFLNPNDEKIAELVQKLEKDVFFAESDSDAQEEFSMQKLQSFKKPNEPIISEQLFPRESLDRELALLDVRFERGQWKEAREQLSLLFRAHPLNKEILLRKEKIKELESDDIFWGRSWIEPLNMRTAAEKRRKLEDLLGKIDARRRS